jgi:septin family protein
LQIYQFPDCDSDEDEEFKQQDRELKACVPFAVVGSNTVIEVAGKKVRGRQYPWGVVEGEFSSDLPLLSSRFTVYKSLLKQHALKVCRKCIGKATHILKPEY